MQKHASLRLGIIFRREYAPEALPEFAQAAEKNGFDELWVVEDCAYGGGVAAAAAALACTKTITVGLGILPAPVRNPVFTAMQIATLSRLFPGRFLPGIGHGVARWMRQVGALPPSQLTALREVAISVRALLAGETVHMDGDYVHLDGVRLVHPPEAPPPLSLGVVGPRSLALSGQAADGTILSEYSSPSYVRWARAQIQSGMVNPQRPHRITVFNYACAAESTAAARDRLRPMAAAAIACGKLDAKLRPMGLLEQAKALREKGGLDALISQMPDAWIDALTIAGTPDDWQAALMRLGQPGVQSVVFSPLPDSTPKAVHQFARHLF